jgi:hypothetical protein
LQALRSSSNECFLATLALNHVLNVAPSEAITVISRLALEKCVCLAARAACLGSDVADSLLSLYAPPRDELERMDQLRSQAVNKRFKFEKQQSAGGKHCNNGIR